MINGVNKQRITIRPNRKNGKWQLITITQYSDMSVSRNLLKEYDTYEKAAEIYEKRTGSKAVCQEELI